MSAALTYYLISIFKDNHGGLLFISLVASVIIMIMRACALANKSQAQAYDKSLDGDERFLHTMAFNKVTTIILWFTGILCVVLYLSPSDEVLSKMIAIDNITTISSAPCTVNENQEILDHALTILNGKD